MNDRVKAFELTDEQLRMVTGGGGDSLPLCCIPTDGNTSVNVSYVTQSNTILFRKMSNSSIGPVCVSQSNTTVQRSSVG
jgi:hypothetical protein